MARELPSYVVRNLVEAAMKRNERKTMKQPDRQSLCVALPTEANDIKKETVIQEEIKSLLKLHRRFEDDALRRLRKRTVQDKSLIKPSLNQNGFNNSPIHRTIANEDYFHDIMSKLDQMQSVDLSTKFPAVPNTVHDTARFRWSAGRRLQSLTYPQKGNDCKVSPLATKSIRRHSCPGSLRFIQDDLRRQKLINNYEKRCFSPTEKYPQNTQTLEQLLTIIPLTSENFAAYDSMSRFEEANPLSRSVAQDEMQNSRNSETSASWLVPAGDRRSEDALSVNYEKYANDDVGIDTRDVDSEFTETSRALVEYKPIYKKNVHFSEDLHEIHLYSPVQDHRIRRRRRRSRTEEGN